jgi:Kelch motif
MGAIVLTGCGGGGAAPARRTTTTSSPPPAPAVSVALHVRRLGVLPAPVQDPATTGTATGALLAGGLDTADVSVVSEVLVPPGRKIGVLPSPLHDAAAATIGSHAYLFGGGNLGSSAAIVRFGAAPRPVARLPKAASDVAAATIGDTAYVVGGYDGSVPLDTILAWRPGEPVARVAGHLPQPLRYAAVASAGGRLIVAGGTVGTSASRDILAFANGSVRRIGRLPSALTHAAAATLRGRVYLFGGRGAALGTQRRTILAIDPATGRVRRAGRLPVGLSDLGAATVGGRVLLVGGRDRAGQVHAQVWSAR